MLSFFVSAGQRQRVWTWPALRYCHFHFIKVTGAVLNAFSVESDLKHLTAGMPCVSVHVSE